MADDEEPEYFYRYHDDRYWNDIEDADFSSSESSDSDTSLFLSDTQMDADEESEDEPTQEEIGAKYFGSGTCAKLGCEVKIVLDGGSELFACKHRLAMGSKFFEVLLSSDEAPVNKDGQFVFRLGEVSTLDMYQYLRCSIEEYFDLKPIPQSRTKINDLIGLASKFRNEFLEDRIVKTLLNSSIKRSSRFKSKLLIQAFRQRSNCPSLLNACIRLCATMRTNEILQMRTWIGPRLLSAVFSLRIESYGKAPFCPVCRYRNKPTLLDRFDFKTNQWTHSRPECKARVQLAPIPSVAALKRLKINKTLLQ